MSVIFKCKMCGGDLNIEPDQKISECEYCGSIQTLPRLEDDKIKNLFARANRLRMKGEFDKAAQVYEKIILDYPEEAESYWGLCLCEYGIEYVDDEATGRKIPTCHRTSSRSIFKDTNFEQVMENAGPDVIPIYRNEAKEIDRIQRSILDIANQEEPFDIFICYKEKDSQGKRTKDSVRAQEIYHYLNKEGYKVFYARITLENKLGDAYEPYIYSALRSARIMLAIGTSFENYNAVWVHNEWSRFLKMMQEDPEKKLIPCYEDIDAYDMPEEFQCLQGQDMRRLGFIQDLILGINKMMRKDQQDTAASPQTDLTSGGSGADALLRRGKMALEDGVFTEAGDYFNRALDMNPECSEAYQGLFMKEMKSRELYGTDSITHKGILKNRNYLRAKQFASEEQLPYYDQIDKILAVIDQQIEAQRAERKTKEQERAEVQQQIADGQTAVGSYNQAKKQLEFQYRKYMDGIRDIELQIQKDKEQLSRQLAIVRQQHANLLPSQVLETVRKFIADMAAVEEEMENTPSSSLKQLVLIRRRKSLISNLQCDGRLTHVLAYNDEVKDVFELVEKYKNLQEQLIDLQQRVYTASRFPDTYYAEANRLIYRKKESMARLQKQVEQTVQTKNRVIQQIGELDEKRKALTKQIDAIDRRIAELQGNLNGNSK